ncbi:MAG TPA: M20 family metallopeptidase [Acidimicrobiales bacterium]|nr:M20 family metallopeptidase [Acidimicrobiales bacterium]
MADARTLDTDAGGISQREQHVLDAVDDNEMLGLLRELIAHPSENPPGDEASCAQFLASFLEQEGIACSLAEVTPGRPNLYARTGSSEPTLVLCGHLDTVPAGDGWTADPFAGAVANGQVYGRGACDMKAGLACMAAVLLALKRSGVSLRGSVALHAVIDEEETSAGARRAASEAVGDWVIVTEPSAGKVLPTGNGQLIAEIVFSGWAVHSSHPEDGRNAIHDAAAFVSLVEEQGRRLAAAPYPGIGPATYSVNLVRGGRSGSTVADRCTLTLDRRVLPSESLEDAEAEVRDLLGRLASQRPGLHWQLSRTVAFPPLQGTNAAHLVQVLNTAILDLGGTVGDGPQGMRFATDAAWYATDDRPAVVFGPGDIAFAHQPDEHVDIGDLNFSARVLALVCLRLLT